MTAAELEAEVEASVHEVGRRLLARLLEFEAWAPDAGHATQWDCPACGRPSPRAKDEDDAHRFEQTSLQTTLGPVPWRAPLFFCPKCRRLFSPRSTLL